MKTLAPEPAVLYHAGMIPKQPTYFRHEKQLFALFPGSPPRGVLIEQAGYWMAWCPDMKAQDKAMAFQIGCHALSNFTHGMASMGLLDKNALRFACSTKRKHELRAVLNSGWYGHNQFQWDWVDERLEIPEQAKWVAHPSAFLSA